MPRLSVEIPKSSDLLARVESAARELRIRPKDLARAVLEVGLDSYVNAQREARQREPSFTPTETAEHLKGRFSGALPARRLPETI